MLVLIHFANTKTGKMQVLVALHREGSDFELSSLVRCDPMKFTYRAGEGTDLATE